MPEMREHHSSKVTKLLLIGDSGSGKTGALASLANAGYNLRILDFDNGLDILKDYLSPEAFDRVHYVTLTDKMKFTDDGIGIPVGEPTAWKRAVKLLTRWKIPDGEDLGAVSKWGDKDVLVVDSLTLQGLAAMHWIKYVQGKVMEADWGFYGGAMESQSKMLEMLYSDAIKCNVIVTAHVISIAPKKSVEVIKPDGTVSVQQVDAGDAQLYPSALGNKLPPKVGRFFNAILRCHTDGNGKHWIHTTGNDLLELKTPAPNTIPKRLELKTGLAEYFELIRKVAA